MGRVIGEDRIQANADMPMIHSIIKPASPAPRVRDFVRMFQPQFEEAIVSLRKPHTVRKRPLRMPEPGDRLSCRVWTGLPYRSPQREFFRGRITKVEDFVLMHLGKRMRVGLQWQTAAEAQAFARADGFEDYEAMLRWFDRTHDLARAPFEGIVIHWVPLEGGEIEP